MRTLQTSSSSNDTGNSRPLDLPGVSLHILATVSAAGACPPPLRGPIEQAAHVRDGLFHCRLWLAMSVQFSVLNADAHWIQAKVALFIQEPSPHKLVPIQHCSKATEDLPLEPVELLNAPPLVSADNTRLISSSSAVR